MAMCDMNGKWNFTDVEMCLSKYFNSFTDLFILNSSLTFNCSELPCPKQPPPSHKGEGAERIYGLLETWYVLTTILHISYIKELIYFSLSILRYRCQNGYIFENGDFPYWINQCLPNKNWEMRTDIVPCISRF